MVGVVALKIDENLRKACAYGVISGGRKTCLARLRRQNTAEVHVFSCFEGVQKGVLTRCPLFSRSQGRLHYANECIFEKCEILFAYGCFIKITPPPFSPVWGD